MLSQLKKKLYKSTLLIFTAFGGEIMKKMLGALALMLLIIGMASAAGENLQKAKAMSVKKFDASCITKAIEKRENSLISAIEKYAEAMKDALNKRKDALIKAWFLPTAEGKKKAIKEAWDAFRTARTNAVGELKNDRNAAWNQWKADIQACKLTKTVAAIDATSAEVDTNIAQ